MKRRRALIVLGAARLLMVLDAVITLYALVMAAFMLIGGRFGDIMGRRRMFLLGLAAHGTGSALTAVAPTLWVLAQSYRGRDRALADGVIGGLAGAGVAVGPLPGGWVTTYLGHRVSYEMPVSAVVVAVAA